MVTESDLQCSVVKFSDDFLPFKLLYQKLSLPCLFVCFTILLIPIKEGSKLLWLSMAKKKKKSFVSQLFLNWEKTASDFQIFIMFALSTH